MVLPRLAARPHLVERRAEGVTPNQSIVNTKPTSECSTGIAYEATPVDYPFLNHRISVHFSS